ncbi:MAG: hypothetical protein KDN19_12470 [Verrucomicrobiae bacterium]|nr:hypothetical protein [Verrucomicrobiae bacterium]
MAAVAAYVLSVGPVSKLLWNTLEVEAAAGSISKRRIEIQRFYFDFYKPLFWIEHRLTPAEFSPNSTILGKYIRAFGVGDRIALGGGPG